MATRDRAQMFLGKQNSGCGTEEEAPVSSVDVIGVGFGLSSIAIAAALADCNSDGEVCFFERQTAFSWSCASLLSGNKIRSSFLRDLATPRNPRSKFTFINYLYSTNQLVAFTNASSLQPSKLIMSQYLAWVAEQIAGLGWVSYGREVHHIEPVVQVGDDQISSFQIHYSDVATGILSVMTAKKVIVATGSAPYIPSSLSASDLAPYVVHSKDCSNIFTRDSSRLPDVAVIGGTQEGAEIYEYLQEHYGGHRATLFIEDSALRPIDNSAFVQNLIGVPDSDMASLPAELREKVVLGHDGQKQTLIPVDLLERLYDMDYAQKIGEKNSSKLRFKVEPMAEVVGAEIVAAPSQSRVRLHVRHPRTGAVRKSERSFDYIVAATGYRRNPDLLLSSLSSVLDGGRATVNCDYMVNFKKGCLRKGCGIWSPVTLDTQPDHGDAFMHLAEQGRKVSESVIVMLREGYADDEKHFEQISLL